VFKYIRENFEREFLLRVSYLEIYNESIRDLLSPEAIDLKIHEDRKVRASFFWFPFHFYYILMGGCIQTHLCCSFNLLIGT
jgi:hypothetical protein